MARVESSLDLTWDLAEDRRQIRKPAWPAAPSLIVLDELHKFQGWKRWVKGEFDHYREHHRFLVTGSARMDVFRRGGDSLQGRYHHYRLHPFSYREAEGLPLNGGPLGRALDFAAKPRPDVVDALMRFGGFPEPWLAGTERTLRRWRKDRTDRFFREDVRDLEAVRDIGAIETLAGLVAERVSSPLSINALREDLEVSHRALQHWIDVLDHLYHLFMIRPFTHRRVRGLKKMPKVYLWDHTLVESEAARFENLVASHLLKMCHALEDCEGFSVDLMYLRDRDGREVDFLVLADSKPWFAVEVKLSDETVDPSLRYFRDRLQIPFCYQVVRNTSKDVVKDGVRVLPGATFLSGIA
jgi:predicted AAA+ superfamily ATPase